MPHLITFKCHPCHYFWLLNINTLQLAFLIFFHARNQREGCAYCYNVSFFFIKNILHPSLTQTFNKEVSQIVWDDIEEEAFILSHINSEIIVYSMVKLFSLHVPTQEVGVIEQPYSWYSASGAKRVKVLDQTVTNAICWLLFLLIITGSSFIEKNLGCWLKWNKVIFF